MNTTIAEPNSTTGTFFFTVVPQTGYAEWNLEEFAQYEPEEDVERVEWEGVLAVIGHPTSDRRLLIPGEVSHRDLPLPFLVQTATEDGHRGAEVAGRIEKISHIPAEDFERKDEFNLHDLTEGAVIVFAEGTLDGSEHELDAIRMIENGAGVSIDMPPDRVAPFDPDTLEELDPEEVAFEDLIFGNLLTGIAGKISAATIVSIPAFEEALKKANKPYTLYVYEGANHAFNNDTSEARYHKPTAEQAWARTVAFLKEHLKA